MKTDTVETIKNVLAFVVPALALFWLSFGA
jgi:hypothetical protein